MEWLTYVLVAHKQHKTPENSTTLFTFKVTFKDQFNVKNSYDNVEFHQAYILKGLSKDAKYKVSTLKETPFIIRI